MGPDDRIRLGLVIEPLDTLFFRGGRPFGSATRAEGELPQPQTLAGALRTALLAAHGFDFAAFEQRRKTATEGESIARLLEELGAPEGLTETWFRGPWLTKPAAAGPLLPMPANRVGAAPVDHRLEVAAAGPLLPMPANLFIAESGKWSRADPLADHLPGWDAPQPGRRPLWRRGAADAKRPGGFLTLDGMERFLNGELPDVGDWVQPDCLFDFVERTGLEIDADTLTGVEGRLFSTRLLVLKPKVCFYAEALVPGRAVAALKSRLVGLFPWGGEGRYAVARVLERPVEWPSGGPPQANALWLLATPGLFARAGLPDRIADADLTAIASRPAVAVSGWDVARNVPRPTRFAAPAGSVYFVNHAEGPTGDGPMSLCDDPEDRAQGWGFALRGVWKNA